MTKVYVITCKIQHMYDTETYFEVAGVAYTPEGANKIAYKANKRGEVVDIDVGTHIIEGCSKMTDHADTSEEEIKEKMIQECFMFMESIYKYYGADKGEEMWDTIVTSLDPSIKRQMLLRMFKGDYKTEITIRKVVTDSKKVHIIKKIREITGLGLKEAKDIADQVCPTHNSSFYDNLHPVTFKVDPDKRRVAVRELEELGCII